MLFSPELCGERQKSSERVLSCARLLITCSAFCCPPPSAQKARIGTVAHGPHATKIRSHAVMGNISSLAASLACAQQPREYHSRRNVSLCNCLAEAGRGQMPSPCHDGAALRAGQVANGNRPLASRCSSATRTETTPIDVSNASRSRISAWEASDYLSSVCWARSGSQPAEPRGRAEPSRHPAVISREPSCDHDEHSPVSAPAFNMIFSPPSS